MPTRARAEADAAAAAEGKVKQPRGRKPTGYQIWDGTPPGTWRNERGEAYQPGAPSHEVEPPMPTELAGVVTQTEWSAGHAQVVEQIDKIKVAVETVADAFESMGLSRRAGIRSVLRIVDWEKIVMGGPDPHARMHRVSASQWTPEIEFPKHWERCTATGMGFPNPMQDPLWPLSDRLPPRPWSA